MKKLSLHRETIRRLTNDEVTEIGGATNSDLEGACTAFGCPDDWTKWPRRSCHGETCGGQDPPP